jgi:hypothetical protein
MAGTMIAVAQTSGGPATASGQAAASPVAQVRDARSWEYGPFVSYGNGVGGDQRSQYRFLNAGLQLAKPLTPVLHAGILSGQFEFGANIMPLWEAYTPAPHTATYICIVAGKPVSCVLPVAGGTYRGVSLTPVIFRWNFLTQSRRVQPWFQGAGGLIYTTRQFPPSFSSTTTPPIYTVDGSTSVWNFSPQGGGGIHYFTSAKRSIDLGVNAVHISSASLGDRNPGVNASIQVQVGYTFWK